MYNEQSNVLHTCKQDQPKVDAEVNPEHIVVVVQLLFRQTEQGAITSYWFLADLHTIHLHFFFRFDIAKLLLFCSAVQCQVEPSNGWSRMGDWELVLSLLKRGRGPGGAISILGVDHLTFEMGGGRIGLCKNFFLTLADLVLSFLFVCLFFYCKRLCRKFFSQIFHHPHPPQKSNGSTPLTVNALISPPGSLLNFGPTGGEEGLIRQGGLLEKGGGLFKKFWQTKTELGYVCGSWSWNVTQRLY